jgi:NADH-quinone oxidoreductase subunit M
VTSASPLLILDVLIFLPFVVAGLVLLLPQGEKAQVRAITLMGMLASLATALWAWASFDRDATVEYQFEHQVPWLTDLGVSYHLGVDGLSLSLVLLTAVLGPLAVLSAWRTVQHREREFHVALLVIQGATFGAYCALDTLLFYGFFELLLLPMAFVIGLWGAEDRRRVAMKYFVTMLVGSVLLLLGFIAVAVLAAPESGRTFDAPTITVALQGASRELAIALKHGPITDGVVSPLAFGLYRYGPGLFALLALGFAVKVPLLPLHTWVPETQAQAPAAASLLLSGKLGVYGFWRFALPFFPLAARNAQTVVAAVAVVGIVYASLVALSQRDIKQLLGYATIAHLGLAVLGVFAFTTEGASGSAWQLVSHGLTAGALFLLAGFVQERRLSRVMTDYGGVAKVMPLFAATFVVATFGSIAVPGTSGFVGEFLVLLGSFKSQLPLGFGAAAATSLVLGAASMLWLVQRVCFGPLSHQANRALADLTGRELVAVLPLVALIVVLGLKPQPLLDVINSSAERSVARLSFSLAEDVVDDGALMAGEGLPSPAHTDATPARRTHPEAAGL